MKTILILLFITICISNMSARSIFNREYETRSDDLNTKENNNSNKYSINVPIGKGI